MITKKIIKPISKYGLANVNLDNYYTKPQVDSKLTTIDNEKQDILSAGNNITISNNVISANVDLSDYYTKSETENKIFEAISNIPEPNLSNVVKTNETNTISTSKLLTSNQQDNTIFEISHRLEKKMYFDFIQNRTGYRNWNHLIFRAKLANDDYVNILDCYSQDVNEGLFLAVENNKITFDSPTLITNIDTPINDNDAANKQYVDNQIANIPQPQEINLVEGVEVAIQNYQINGKQVYKMYITTDDQFKSLISTSDYLDVKGLIKKDNYYKSYPWFWGTQQVYSLDLQSSGGLCNKGCQTTGHKLTITYTKK